jgi:hypothetical protein
MSVLAGSVFATVNATAADSTAVAPVNVSVIEARKRGVNEPFQRRGIWMTGWRAVAVTVLPPTVKVPEVLMVTVSKLQLGAQDVVSEAALTWNHE